MREIKFRAWFEPNIEMKYMGEEIHISTFLGKYVQTNSKIMQFTGLKDKNGKEIYEGDIVKNKHRENIFVIEWDNTNSSFTQRNETSYISLFLDWAKDLESKYNLEVIGNIYENGDLLEND